MSHGSATVLATYAIESFANKERSKRVVETCRSRRVAAYTNVLMARLMATMKAEAEREIPAAKVVAYHEPSTRPKYVGPRTLRRVMK